MASVQDRNKLKRVSYDTWSTREQLCLASSVLKSGDQNWIGVSRSLKPFAEKEALRPPDWFSQKSCAMQYAILIENADAPKRKKRESGETTSESIVRRLTQERIAELGQILAFQRDEYQQLKAEVNSLRTGTITEEKLQKMWLAIEQEERDQEQKARAHAAWLAKRQQKQDIQTSLQTINVPTTRKTLEATSEPQEIIDSTNDDEEKKNRGGRSPLLTSLLKSPSPTTQIQTPTSSVQVTSPMIASLLGSSPKVSNTQMTTTIAPPQLHPLVSHAITNTVTERPSVGAPTLSMLLELPANLERASLASLQQAASNIQQQISPTEIHIQSHHPVKRTISQTETTNVRSAASVLPSIPVNESMVQIIDQVDDVIRKDIMADVINKDEINEIIGDLEELIKEEITASPRNLPIKIVTEMPTIVENLSIPEIEKIIVPERPEPRDVDEPVSLSNSPQSEMAIEEIDQSTSSIAEIIGTVAIEPVEPKVSVAPVIAEEPSRIEEEEKKKEELEDEEENKKKKKEEEDKEEEQQQEAEKEAEEEEEEEEEEEDEEEEEEIEPVTKNEEKSPIELEIPVEPEKQSITEETSLPDKKVTIEEEKVDEETKKNSEDTVIPEVKAKSPEPIEKTTLTDKPTEKESEDVAIPAITSEIDETSENSIEPKESSEETKEKNDTELDQLELNLAKITGDQSEIGSAEVVSVCSEVTNDVPSIEDNDKSQDISMILEDDDSSQSNASKKKDTDEQSLIEHLIDGSDSQESFKQDSTEKDATKETINESSMDAESPTTPETAREKKDEEEAEKKVDDSKDSEDVTSSLTTTEIEKNEKIVEATPLPEMEKEEEDEEEEEEEETIEAEKSENDEKKENMEKVEKEEKEEKEEEEVKTETEIEETTKPKVEENEEKKICVTPEPRDEDKPDVKDESDIESLMKQLEEPKNEETEIKEDKEDDEKPMDSDTCVKKETGESAGSICDDIGDLDEEESSLSKLSGGRAMKTYSKKQTIAVDSEPENESSGENADYRTWKKAVMLVYNRLATHKYASVFLRPITEDQAPGYHSVIFRPMDLSAIKKNIDNGTIRSTMHFQRDVMLMFQNAIMYNKQDTFVYKMALSMQEECLQHMQILVQVTGEGQLRRETRTAASSSSETSESSVKRKRSHITPSPHDTDSPRGKKRRKSEND